MCNFYPFDTRGTRPGRRSAPRGRHRAPGAGPPPTIGGVTDPAPGPGTASGGLPRPPAPLVVAVSLALVEALVLVGLGVAEVVALDGSRLVMGASTALFFVLYGGGLAVCAVALYRLRAWARAPVVLAQLIQLLLVYSFWGGETTGVAVALGVVGVVTLAGIFHPASLRAVDEADA